MKRAQFKHICLVGNNSSGVQPIEALPLIRRSTLLAAGRGSKDAPDGAASGFETCEDVLLTMGYGNEARDEMQKE